MFKTKEVAEQIRDAALEIFKLLSITFVSWEQRVFFRGSAEFKPRLNLENSKLEGLVEVPLVIDSQQSLYLQELTHRTMQSLLSLTIYHYSKIGMDGTLVRVLASCPIDKEYSQDWQKKKEILGQGYGVSLKTWIRTTDGRIGQEQVLNNAPERPYSERWKSWIFESGKVILGMSYSALRFGHNG